MSHRDEILRQAMALPHEDRAYVVTLLERSLSDADEASDGHQEFSGDAISGQAFVAELERRSAAYRAAETRARPADEVLTDLKTRQASENST